MSGRLPENITTDGLILGSLNPGRTSVCRQRSPPNVPSTSHITSSHGTVRFVAHLRRTHRKRTAVPRSQIPPAVGPHERHARLGQGRSIGVPPSRTASTPEPARCRGRTPWRTRGIAQPRSPGHRTCGLLGAFDMSTKALALLHPLPLRWCYHGRPKAYFSAAEFSRPCTIFGFGDLLPHIA